MSDTVAAPSLVTLPQFYFCWSTHGLEGTGYGVRAATPDLLQLSDGWRRYDVFCDYLPSAERQGRGPGEGPVCIARYRLPQRGYLIARKTPTGRTGTFFVHALIDDEGIVSAAAIAASAHAPFWVSSEDALEPSERTLPAFDAAAWDQFDVPPPPEVEQEELVELLTRFAGSWENRRSVPVAGEGEAALERIRALLALLPRAVVDKLCFSSYEARPRPGAIDLVAAATAAPASQVPNWAQLLTTIARERPADFARVRDDRRITDLGGLVVALEATHGELTPASLRAAVEHGSDFLDSLLERPELADVLLAAIDAEPQWWRRVGLKRLGALPIAQAFPDPATLLAVAAARVLDERRPVAVALVDLYCTLEPDPASRLRDLEALPATAESAVRGGLALLLLSDQLELSPHAAELWEPYLVSRWSQLDAALESLPVGLWPRTLERSIAEGERDGEPRLNVPPDRLVIEAVALMARDAAHEERAASFLAAVAGARADGSGFLVDALRAQLPAAFVRGPLAAELAARPTLTSSSVRRELLRAGVADAPDFLRLVLDEVAPAPGSAPDAEAVHSRRLWGRR